MELDYEDEEVEELLPEAWRCEAALAWREVQRERLLECLEKRLSGLKLQLDPEKILLTTATQRSRKASWLKNT